MYAHFGANATMVFSGTPSLSVAPCRGCYAMSAQVAEFIRSACTQILQHVLIFRRSLSWTRNRPRTVVSHVIVIYEMIPTQGLPDFNGPLLLIRLQPIRRSIARSQSTPSPHTVAVTCQALPSLISLQVRQRWSDIDERTIYEYRPRCLRWSVVSDDRCQVVIETRCCLCVACHEVRSWRCRKFEISSKWM